LKMKAPFVSALPSMVAASPTASADPFTVTD
jgi:hypothetical protein